MSITIFYDYLYKKERVLISLKDRETEQVLEDIFEHNLSKETVKRIIIKFIDFIKLYRF